MSKDMLGSVVRAAVSVPQGRMELLARIASDLAHDNARGEDWFECYERVRKEGLPDPQPDHIIDCDATPSISNNRTILPDDEQLQNRVRGAFKWDKESQKDALHLDPGQKDDKSIEGHKLREALANQPVLNACVFDYLLANQHLIPEEWKGKAVFFWGTIYRNRNGNLCVRCLLWGRGRWHPSFDLLDNDWDNYRTAAVSAS